MNGQIEKPRVGDLDIESVIRLLDQSLTTELYTKLYHKFIQLECFESDVALRRFVKDNCPNLNFLLNNISNAHTVRDRVSSFIALLAKKRHIQFGSALSIFVRYLYEQGLLTVEDLN
ncbi:hypothetical protein KBC89_02540 [Candidatus Woesebacteria bacterium]|nr:hypothetical protein [Candidatus Woesebacteria bacterium]